MVEEAARRKGHEIACVIDPGVGSTGQLAEADVCIDFSEPGAVLENIEKAARAGVAIAVGTTGWYDRLGEARRAVEGSGIGLVYGSNFSIGVNLMFKITRYASELFRQFSTYDPFIEEIHHKFKKDAPSGTALSLKRIIEAAGAPEVPTASTRAGYVPGTHRVGFDSEADTLTITHAARSRSGFAEGAVLAAEWIYGRTGFYEFIDVIDELHDLKSRA
jgi:4-hydroxy-tetrahydrodipicolinate reductase